MALFQSVYQCRTLYLSGSINHNIPAALNFVLFKINNKTAEESETTRLFQVDTIK